MELSRRAFLAGTAGAGLAAVAMGNKQALAEDVIAGNERLKAMLSGSRYAISFVTALEPLCEALEGCLTERLIPIRIQILYPWMDD